MFLAPKILDWHYTTRPTADQRAKFHADRPTHLGDLALDKKIFKTSAVKHKPAPKAIA